MEYIIFRDLIKDSWLRNLFAITLSMQTSLVITER